MPRRIKVATMTQDPFGRRLARLRKAANLTQLELATEIGISRRMVAYYEGETDQPPAALLPLIARALHVSTDEILGVAPLRQRRRSTASRLSRRLKQLERLPPRERRQVVQVIDAFLERERLKKRAS